MLAPFLAAGLLGRELSHATHLAFQHLVWQPCRPQPVDADLRWQPDLNPCHQPLAGLPVVFHLDLGQPVVTQIVQI